MCDKCGYEHTEANARKLWRKHGFGRLYRKQIRWYKSWGYSDMRYMAKNGTSGMYMRDAGTVIHTALGIDEE